MPQPHVIAVILNTNRRQYTLDCLSSLEGLEYQNLSTIVLDNQSSDGSVEAIHSAFLAVEVIELETNLGFSGNNNVGIQAAMAQGADWIYVINEDVVMDPDCLSWLVKIGESDPRIGILGPMVYHDDEPEMIQTAGGVMDHYWRAWHLAQNELDVGQYVDPHLVDWISGCAIMVRRSMVEQIGILDDRFFYYWDETEWCLRAREHGWKVMHVPQAKLWHKGVQRDYKPGPSVTYYNTRNRFLMLSKHDAPAGAWFVAWYETLRTLASWSIRPQWRSMRDHKMAMWQGVMDFLQHRWGRMPGK